jgi:hypothetical protein
MRRALVALSLTLPACLSGFSEIRIVRSDAAVDASRVDVLVSVDTPGGPSDALDLPQVPDVPAAAMDAPEVAVSADAVPVIDAPDVVDAGQHADAVDVVRADQVDVGMLTDRGDAFDVQCPTPLCNGVCVNSETDPAHCGRCGNSCGSGEECVGGRCGRWRFGLAIAARREDRARYAAMRSGVEVAGREVCPFIARGRPVRTCRSSEIFPQDTANWCNNFVNVAVLDEDLVWAAADGQYVPGCVRCTSPDAGAPATFDGMTCREWSWVVACCAFE